MEELPCTGPFRIGDDIIGYKVLGLLGSGGHAHVYESKDPYLGHPVAIKVIQRPPGGSDIVSRGRAEAMILNELQHPNVVRVHLARPIGNSMICIVMEKLKGISLRHMLRLYKRFTITETLHIVRQIADALSAAHKMNVIHRDIKPENVFVLPPDNKVKVLDFGIAKLAGLGLTTNKFRFQGTPIYMAPEHLSDGTVTVRSDVYQLMLVAFEMMTGAHPYLVGSDCGNIDAVVIRQLQRPPPLLSTKLPGAPPAVEFLIEKGTARDPRQRYQSMDELIVAVDKLLRDRPGFGPQEANSIRYLDEQAVQDALALDSAHDPWADAEEPLESADTEAAAPPTFSIAPVVPSVAVRAGDGRIKAGETGAPRGSEVASSAAKAPRESSAVSARPTPTPPPAADATAARRTSMGLGPPIGRAESIASIPRPVVKRASTALAPTMEISRDPTAPARSERPSPTTKPRPTPSPQPSAIQKANPSRTPVPSDAVSARPVQTADGYAAAPSPRSTKILTPKLLLAAALIGSVIGLGSTWQDLHQAYLKRKARAQEAAPANSAQMVAETAPSGRKSVLAPPAPVAPSVAVASPLPVVRRIPEEPAAGSEPSVLSTPVAPTRTVVAAPSKPKKPTPRNEDLDTVTPLIPGNTTKATKEELARMQARVREFKADMDREAREKKAREATK